MPTRETTYVYKQEGLESVQRQLAQTGAASDTATAKVNRGARDASTGMKVLDSTMSEIRAQGDRLSASLGPLDGIMRSLGPAGALLAGGVGAGVAILSKAVTEAAQAERAMVKIEAVLKATGNASGLTAGKIDDLTKALSRSTLATEEEAKGAATQLLSFRTIAGDTFGEVLKLSQDLAAAGFGGLADNAVKLGKALENPAEGLEGLSRLGVILTDEQKELAKQFAETGDQAAAQNIILTALRDRVGGAGTAEGNTLVGAWHNLTGATSAWFEELGNNSELLPWLKDRLNDVAAAVDRTTEAMKKPDSKSAMHESLASLKSLLQDPAFTDTEGPFQNKNKGALLEGLRAQIKSVEAAVAALDAAEASLATKNALLIQQDTTRAAQLDEIRSSLGDINKKWADNFEAVDKAAKAGEAKAKRDTENLMAFAQDMKRTDEELAKVAANRAEREDKALKDRIKEERDAYYDRLERQRDEEKAQADILKERQQQFTDYYTNAVSVLQESLLDPTAEGWDDTLKGMFSKFKRWIASLAIEAAARPILVPILAQFFGNGVTGAANAAGGASGLVSNGLSAANLLKGGSLTSSVFGGFATSGLGTSLGLSTAPAMAATEGFGALGAYATTAPTLTGAGTAFSFMTSPTGIGLAVAAGLILSKLLKGKPSDKAEYTDLNLLTGARFEDDLGQKKDDPENRAAVNAMADAIVSLKSLLQDKTGGTVGLGRVVLSVGDRGTPYRANVDGAERGFQTEQDAIAYVTQELVKSLTGVPARVQRAVDGMDWTNVDAAFAGLDKVLNFEEAIKQLTQAADERSPIQQMFENITKNFVVLGDEMKKFGYTQEELADLQNQAVAKARAALLKDRAAEFYGETGRGYLNTVGGILAADRTRRADDLAGGLDPSMSAAIFTAQITRGLDAALGDAGDYAGAVAIIADIKAQFAAYPAVLTAADAALARFGTSLTTVPAAINPAIRAALKDDRLGTLYGATGRGYLNSVGGVLRDYKTRQREDGNDAELKGITDAIFGADLKTALDRSLGDATDYASAVAIIADIKAQFGAYPAVLTEADAALGRFQSALTAVPDVLTPLRDVASLLAGLYDDQIDNLDRQAAALRDSSEGWSRLSDTIRRTRQQFGLDSQLSPYSLERRVNDSMALYRSTQSRANAGDVKAAEELPELARTALGLAREFYRSSADYNTFFEEVNAGLRATESFASRQLTVEQMQLTALEAIRAALVGQRAAVTNPNAGAPGATANAADWANLGNSYAAARQRFLDGGGSLQDWNTSATHKNVWERARDDLIGGTTDQNFLLASLAESRRQKDTPLFESTGASWEASLLARLGSLGIPAFARGGMVENTGLIYAHAGERVLTASQQDGIAAEVRALSNQVAGLTRMMAEAQTRLIDVTRDVAETNRAMADDARYTSVQALARGRVA
jgi:Prophage tail length tape measure protein